jgi:hypothetical protein
MGLLIGGALVATALWFVIFTLMVVGQYRASAGTRPGRPDPIGRRLEASAKWALIGGLALWFAYSGLATLDLALGLGLGLPI